MFRPLRRQLSGLLTPRSFPSLSIGLSKFSRRNSCSSEEIFVVMIIFPLLVDFPLSYHIILLPPF